MHFRYFLCSSCAALAKRNLQRIFAILGALGTIYVILYNVLNVHIKKPPNFKINLAKKTLIGNIATAHRNCAIFGTDNWTSITDDVLIYLTDRSNKSTDYRVLKLIKKLTFCCYNIVFFTVLNSVYCKTVY